MRWLYHVLDAGRVPEALAGAYAPPSLAAEGFVHCSFHPDVADTARAYFAGVDVRVLRIDPRRVDAEIEIADTPRGPMPHVFGAIPSAAIAAVLALSELSGQPDEI